MFSQDNTCPDLLVAIPLNMSFVYWTITVFGSLFQDFLLEILSFP